MADEHICSICQENITTETGKVILSCNHMFHLGCVGTWTLQTKNCPYCRGNLKESECIRRNREEEDDEEEDDEEEDDDEDEDEDEENDMIDGELTLLMKASKEGHIDIICNLLDDPTNKINKQNNKGLSALHCASRYSQLESMKKLLELGADINCKTHSGNTPIIITSVVGNIDGMWFLFNQNADIKHKNKQGHTVLHVLNKNEPSFIEACINKGFDVNECDNDLWTPLMWMSQDGFTPNIKALIRLGANVNHKSLDKTTPLQLACIDAEKETIVALIDAGANIDDNDKNGNTPLFSAIFHDYIDAIEIILKYKPNMSLRDKNGDTPLYYAIEHSNYHIIEMITEYEKKIYNKHNNLIRGFVWGCMGLAIALAFPKN